MIDLKRKRHLFGAEKWKWFLLWSGINKNFAHVQEQKKAMSQRHSVYIPPSVKSPLFLVTMIYVVQLSIEIDVIVVKNMSF